MLVQHHPNVHQPQNQSLPPLRANAIVELLSRWWLPRFGWFFGTDDEVKNGNEDEVDSSTPRGSTTLRTVLDLPLPTVLVDVPLPTVLVDG